MAFAHTALAAGVSPLEVMMGAMRMLWDAGDVAGAAAIAKDAAPFVHPRLATIDQRIEDTRTVRSGVSEACAKVREKIAGIAARQAKAPG